MQIGNIKFTEFPVILAPMEDITDLPFRHLCQKFGADLVYTEFVSSEGLVRMSGKSLDKLKFAEEERPIGIQVFGHDTEAMKRAVEIAGSLHPDLIDINFGCPVKKVVNRGAGASLLKDVPRMVEMTRTVVNATKLPVTVKTRLGWDEGSKNIVEVSERLQDAGIQALTIHARTRSQLYSGKADWTLVGEVKNNPRICIPIIGNGDIDSAGKAMEMRNRYGVDGIMIGRASIGNPYLFRQVKHYFKTGELLPALTLEERIEGVLDHLQKSIEYKGERVAVIEMRKQYSGYFRGVFGFKHFRMELLQLCSFNEIRAKLQEILLRYPG